MAKYLGENDVKALLCDSARINRLFPAPVVKKSNKKAEPFVAVDGGTPTLNQMGPSQRGEVLLAHYDGRLALNGDSDTVHHYNGVIWDPVPDKALAREMAAIFMESRVPYSMPSMKNAVDTMKLSLPLMEPTARNLIGFSNGVFDTREGVFRKHSQADWLLIASDVEFIQAEEGESLATHAQAFWKWLTWSTAGNERKADRVLAALYMVMANRYDWQLFLEVTGAGGSGKSVMAEICTMLAGKGNTVSASMKALEEPRERALIVGFSLIIMPDMTRYAGDGAGIKATSDAELKNINAHVTDKQKALEEVLQWKPALFTYKERGVIPESEEILGFIANELIIPSPECVKGDGLKEGWDENNPTGAYYLDETAMIAKLTGALQAQQEQIAVLQKQISAMSYSAEPTT